MFRYSDETAEAVTSGEKLLKESGTIYESFADMMSPEDAKRYLDFLRMVKRLFDGMILRVKHIEMLI